MKKIIILLLLLSIGCQGVDRLVNGSTSEGKQSNQYYSSNKPYENDPEFDVKLINSSNVQKYVGKYSNNIFVKPENVVEVKVMIRNHGYWFEIGMNQPNLTAPCYEYSNGFITFKNINYFDQYCIYVGYSI